MVSAILSETSEVTRLFFFALAALAVAAFPVASAEVAPPDVYLSGLIDFRLRDSSQNATKLIPEPEHGGRRETTWDVTGVVGAEVLQDSLRVSGQARVRGFSAAGKTARLDIDELFAEYALTDKDYLYLGRRTVVFGRSLGINPLDVFAETALLDRTLNASRRRRETPGQDMLGFASLLGKNFTLEGYWAPASSGSLNKNAPHRVLLSGELLLPEWNADFTMLLFKGGRSGAGLSFSQTLSQTILVYSDIILRSGRDRATVRSAGQTGTAGFRAVSSGSGLRLQSSFGLSYTPTSETAINLEYVHDENGYTHREWSEIAKLISRFGGEDMSGAEPGARSSVLRRLNALLPAQMLRRDYLFARYSIPNLLGLGVISETTLLHNLSDHSGALSQRIEHEANDGWLIGAYLSRLYGGGTDEFALRPGKLQCAFYIVNRF